MTLGPLQIPADFWDRDDVRNAVSRRSLGAVLLLVNVHCNASQTRIAAACDLSQGVVSTLMRGKRTVHSFHVLQRIADGLQMPNHTRTAFGLAAIDPPAPAPRQPEPAAAPLARTATPATTTASAALTVPSEPALIGVQVVSAYPRNMDQPESFVTALRRLRTEQKLSQRGLAARALYDPAVVSMVERGVRPPTPGFAAACDKALGTTHLAELAEGEAANRRRSSTSDTQSLTSAPGAIDADDELDALELSNRVKASDVSDETLTRLERAVDAFAIAYSRSPAQEVRRGVRRHLAYVARLVGARKTISQHRRLLVIGGWLSLIGATLNIDLRERASADAQLATARDLAKQAEHAELVAWTLETKAWDLLTNGDYAMAVDLARTAQELAPRGSSVHIQSTAQEGRAWARMGDRAATIDALARTSRLVSPLSAPERPEHHYQYDPGKALAYTATTLSWAGDPAAETYARDVVRQMESGGDGIVRPRRAALARLDLSLALLRSGKPDEAGATATESIASGMLVASTWWRATEVVTAVETAGVRQATELRDAYEAFRPSRR